MVEGMIAGLESRQQQVQAKADAHLERAAELTAEADSIVQQIAELEQRIEQLPSEAQALRDQAAAERELAAQEQQQATELQQQAAQLQQQADALTPEITAKQEQKAPLDQQNQQLLQEIAALQSQTNQKQQQVAQLQSNIDTLNGEIQSLTQQADEKEQLAQAQAELAESLNQETDQLQEQANQETQLAQEDQQKSDEYAAMAADPQNGPQQITYFAYNESGQLIGEYDEAGAAKQEIVYLEGTPVAMLQGDIVYYIHTDHLSTPRAMTDSSGTVVWSWEAKPFGDSVPNEDPDGDSTKVTLNLRFPGQYYDQETGLYYNYYRYYDPNTGRYITSDPIGLLGGLNTYGYVGANPLAFVDPKGLAYSPGGEHGVNPDGSITPPDNGIQCSCIATGPGVRRGPVQSNGQQHKYCNYDCKCDCKGKKIRIIILRISSGSSHDTSCINFGGKFSVHSVMSYLNPGIPNDLIDKLKDRYKDKCDVCND